MNHNMNGHVPALTEHAPRPEPYKPSRREIIWITAATAVFGLVTHLAIDTISPDRLEPTKTELADPSYHECYAARLKEESEYPNNWIVFRNFGVSDLNVRQAEAKAADFCVRTVFDREG